MITDPPDGLYSEGQPDQIDMMTDAECRAELRRLASGAAAITAAMERHLDESKQLGCKWLVELLMTETEHQNFRIAFCEGAK